MITFLALPRAFNGEFDAIQRMAIQSWRTAVPSCQIILFNNDQDSATVRRAAWDLGVVYSPSVDYDHKGRPLVDRIFSAGEDYAVYKWILFTSADMVLDFDWRFVHRILSEIERPFVVGRRWDIEPGAPPESATLHAACGVDYFLYRRKTIGAVPPFVVNGGGADQWFVWKALTAWNMTVIDATEVITAIHVNHTHPEWQNGKAGRQGSEEQAYNRALYEADGMDRLLGVDAAPWVLDNRGLHKRKTPLASERVAA